MTFCIVFVKKEGIFCFRAYALVRSRERSAAASMRAPEALHNPGMQFFCTQFTVFLSDV
jgi:hypothetical protein